MAGRARRELVDALLRTTAQRADVQRDVALVVADQVDDVVTDQQSVTDVVPRCADDETRLGRPARDPDVVQPLLGRGQQVVLVVDVEGIQHVVGAGHRVGLAAAGFQRVLGAEVQPSRIAVETVGASLDVVPTSAGVAVSVDERLGCVGREEHVTRLLERPDGLGRRVGVACHQLVGRIRTIGAHCLAGEVDLSVRPDRAGRVENRAERIGGDPRDVEEVVGLRAGHAVDRLRDRLDGVFQTGVTAAVLGLRGDDRVVAAHEGAAHLRTGEGGVTAGTRGVGHAVGGHDVEVRRVADAGAVDRELLLRTVTRVQRVTPRHDDELLARRLLLGRLRTRLSRGRVACAGLPAVILRRTAGQRQAKCHRSGRCEHSSPGHERASPRVVNLVAKSATQTTEL